MCPSIASEGRTHVLLTPVSLKPQLVEVQGLVYREEPDGGNRLKPQPCPVKAVQDPDLWLPPSPHLLQWVGTVP